MHLSNPLYSPHAHSLGGEVGYEIDKCINVVCFLNLCYHILVNVIMNNTLELGQLETVEMEIRNGNGKRKLSNLDVRVSL